MLESVKEVLTKEIELERIKNFLEMEIEIKRLQELLVTETRLKEFMLQEVDVKTLFSLKSKTEEMVEVEDVETIDTNSIKGLLHDYNAELIGSLQKDHKELLFIYNEIIKNAKAKKFQIVSIHLETFQRLLKQHYHRADEQLYTYLETFIRYKHPKRQKAFSSLNKEMKNISISICYSLSKSIDIQLSNDTFYCFMCSFTKLGIQLNKRINREASLLLNMYEESKPMQLP